MKSPITKETLTKLTLENPTVAVEYTWEIRTLLEHSMKKVLSWNTLVEYLKDNDDPDIDVIKKILEAYL